MGAKLRHKIHHRKDSQEMFPLRLGTLPSTAFWESLKALHALHEQTELVILYSQTSLCSYRTSE